MSVTVASLLAENGGRIEHATMFGDLSEADLTTRLSAYLVRAVAASAAITDAAQRDVATAEYAYYLAFMAVWRRLSTDPASQSQTDAASTSYLAEQIANVWQMAADALAAFQTIVSDTVAPVEDDWPAVVSLRGGTEHA